MAFRKRKNRAIVLWLAVAVVFGNTAVSQAVFANPVIPDFEIPVEPIYVEGAEKPAAPEIDYTEDLLEVTNFGILDSRGEFVEDGGALEEAQASSVTGMAEKTALDVPPGESFDEYRQSVIDTLGGEKSFTEKRLEGIMENLAEQQKRFEKLRAQIAEAEQGIAPLREQADSLRNEIKLLNTQIQATRDKITKVELLVAEKKIQIKDLMFQAQRSQIELAIQQKIVVDYIRLLYGEEQQYLDLYSDGSSTLKLLLAEGSVSENLLGTEYVRIMERTGRKVFYDLEKADSELEDKRVKIEQEQADLQYLYDALAREKSILEENKLAKKAILEETQGQEEKYQLLLEQSIQQQLDAAIAIQNLQENKAMIEAKLAELDGDLEDAVSAEAPVEPARTEPEMVPSVMETPLELLPAVHPEEISETPEEFKTEKPFIWPVKPDKITAYFLDPAYPKKWGTHYAIDIRAEHSSLIRAPANGYVFQTKNNGMGYSYIILAHKHNLVTVYGHVSEIIAQAGSVVKKGEIIGRTGGTPGTRGAGLQTTGPHLHFEVHYKGKPVNPLGYLPLDLLPIEYVPDEYLKEISSKP
ncbi:peptidoglycan DD-metalloendopeptidase family protein [Candidatus Peregrinibacteria bacterium]|nr:peptidoglycan DD-metalloendopeptidase family protein [Candidatus Peregrinibacteria bacterium]